VEHRDLMTKRRWKTLLSRT